MRVRVGGGAFGAACRAALAASHEICEASLTLFYCLEDPATPRWARSIIAGALAYFVLPADAVPDWLPAVGLTDDLGLVLSAAATVGLHLKAGHRARARATLERWRARPARTR